MLRLQSGSSSSSSSKLCRLRVGLRQPRRRVVRQRPPQQLQPPLGHRWPALAGWLLLWGAGK